MDYIAVNVLDIVERHPEQFSEELARVIRFAFEQDEPKTYSGAVARVDEIIARRIVTIPYPTLCETKSWPSTSTDTFQFCALREDGTVGLFSLHIRPTSPRGNDPQVTKLVTGQLT